MDQPMVSVIMAARNAAPYIRQAMDSALRQTCRDLELIVINDASEDDTQAVIDACGDPRVVCIKNETNLHISASTNLGIAASRGKYIAILDSDDAWYPDKLQKQVDWLESHPEDGACFTWVNVVDENDQPLGSATEGLVSVFRQENRPRIQWLRDLLLQGNCLCHPSVVYRADTLRAIGPYDVSLVQLLDYEIYLRLLPTAGIHILREPLMDYRRIQQANASNSAVAGAAHYRAMNEMAIVICDYIMHMPDALFRQVFADRLPSKGYDPELAALERGRVLYSCFSDETIRRVGLGLIRDCIRQPALREKAENAGVTAAEYRQWMAFEDSDSRLQAAYVRENSLSGIVGINRAYLSQKLKGQAGSLKLKSRKGLLSAKARLRRHERLYMMLGAAKRTVTQGPGIAYREFKDAQRIRNAKIACWPSEEERARQQKEAFSRDVKFSVLVPLYNTPEKYLREMIESVLAQTYGNWELCLADGSDAEHQNVEEICREYNEKDSRVRYEKLKENLGFSGNTNACMAMAEGEYYALLDHDDLLHPSALYYAAQAVCDRDADFIYTDEAHFRETPDDAYLPNYKPDFAPDTLRSYNYICHLSVFSRALLEQAGGGLRSEYDGSQDYDLILRLTEQARSIVHIPRILYLWRTHVGSTAADISVKTYTMDAAKRALNAHLQRVGLQGTAQDARIPSTYDIVYDLPEKPLVSIIIPNRDHAEDLQRCVNSIRQKTTWPNWEIVLVENNSTSEEIFRCYEELQSDSRIRVVAWHGEFNYPAINNFGAEHAQGQYLLLLNNDTEVITPDWIERMMMFAQRGDVGAVGCMLYYPDDTVQHAGVILGIGGVAGHAHKYFKRGEPGFMYRMAVAQDLSAVTAACALFPRKVWEQVGGLDERLAVAFNDIDLCMRIRQAGYLVVFTPFAELYHYESRSRGKENTLEKQQRFNSEIEFFQQRWGDELAAGDPYYNPNLTLKRENFSLR